MKFIRLDLLTLLISLFILNGCKNQDTIGLGVISSNQIQGNLIDTSTIMVHTDSTGQGTLVTNGLSQTPLGFFKDPLFGTTESNLVMDLNLPGTLSSDGTATYTVPYGTMVLDSAVLVMRYSPNAFFGDSLASRYKANVYQLGERIYPGHAYYSSQNWAVDKSTLLGTKSFFSRIADSIKIVNPVAGGPDTAIKVPPQLRIPISTAFVNKILFNAPAVQLNSNLVFKNNVKGLYVTLAQDQSGPGGTFMMSLDSAAAIQVYYRNTNGTVIDTGIISIPSFLHAAEIRHTPSATIKAALASTENQKVIYLQGLGGLKSRINFPYLKNILKTVGNDVIINRAELVVTAQPGSTIPFAPLPKLGLYRWDIAHQPILIQDQAQGDPRYFDSAKTDGFYYNQQQDYHFLITGYISDLIRGVTTDYGAFISPVIPTTSVSVAPTAQVAGRTVAVGYDTSSPYRIKLNLFYTKVVR
ncbi:DUF4270 family protein [Mucilaginibacter ximonensis]|uniref:DUF4270 family protein n=1 Tax=Mucilaginibacter ximonensis TaxID=538021 RepID=A0ABW5YBS7_9SPHI